MYKNLKFQDANRRPFERAGSNMIINSGFSSTRHGVDFFLINMLVVLSVFCLKSKFEDFFSKIL